MTKRLSSFKEPTLQVLQTTGVKTKKDPTHPCPARIIPSALITCSSAKQGGLLKQSKTPPHNEVVFSYSFPGILFKH